MKKLFALLVVAGMVSFVACGPSAEEKAKKATEDSLKQVDSLNAIAAVQQKIDDSLALIAKANDSIAHADSVAKKLIK